MSDGFPDGNRLAALDYAFALLDGAESPQDFTLILHLREPPSLDDLRAGARSAMNRFPISGCTMDKRQWAKAAKEFSLNAKGKSQIQSFVNERFDLRVQPPVKQMLATDDTDYTDYTELGSVEACLVTRFHHAAADGLSAALWLGHQLSVAYGLIEAETTRAAGSEVRLRRSKTSVRRSAFAFNGACDPLWTTNYIPSGARSWLTLNFPATDLQRGCRRARGFTYNDLLATCALEMFSRWNQQHDARQRQKIGLWLPMNVRAQSTTGFGNGTSRIRLYARFPAGASLVEKAREVRKQVSWSTANGEWVVPDLPLFTRLPRPLLAPLLKGYLKQPTVDMATGIFSHADRWAGDATEAFKYVARIECIGPLHPRQHLAINGATHQGQTWLTFTYDPALLSAADVRELASLYERQIALARKELA
jgi:hypothetical protein